MKRIFVILFILSSILSAQGLPTRPTFPAGNGTNETFFRVGKLSNYFSWHPVRQRYFYVDSSVFPADTLWWATSSYLGSVDSSDLGNVRTELLDSINVAKDTLYAAINLKASIAQYTQLSDSLGNAYTDIDTAFAQITLEAGNRISQDSTLFAQIDLRVRVDSVINYINISGEGIKIAANKITFDGPSIFKAINGTTDSTTINGGKLTTGTVIADSIRSNYLYGKHIVGGDISIGGGKFTVDSLGILTATDVLITGAIETDSGSVVRGDYIDYLVANKITAGTGIINNLSVFSTLTMGSALTDGTIQSYGWNGTANGFQIKGGAAPTVSVIGGTITGGTVQTAASGERTVIDASGTNIYATSKFGASGITWHAGASSLAIGVEIDLGAITGFHIGGDTYIEGSLNTTAGTIAYQSWVTGLGYRDSTWIVNNSGGAADSAIFATRYWVNSMLASISYTDLQDVPSVFAPSSHGNEAHSSTFLVTETDPTIYAWAKAATDAAYATAAHNHSGTYLPVAGAGDIYTHNASEFVTGTPWTAMGYLTAETDPNVYAWAKAATKPTYTYTEVGAQVAGSYQASLGITGFDSDALVILSGGYLSVVFGTTAYNSCVGNDARLSDARTPVAHNQAWSTITTTPTTLAGYGISSDASIITTGTFADARIASAATWNGKANAFTGFTGVRTFGAYDVTMVNGIITEIN